MRFTPRIIALALSLVCTAIVVLWVRGCRSTSVATLATDAMQDRLAGNAFDLSARDLPLQDAVWLFQDTSFGLGAETDIDLNVDALRAAGLSPDAKVTLDDRGMPLGLALVRLASAAGVACRADDELVYISSPSDAGPLRAFERQARAGDAGGAALSELLHRPRSRPTTRPGSLRHGIEGRPISLTQTTLRRAVQKLGDATGVKVVLDDAALNAAGVDGDAPVSVMPRNTSTASLLALVLRNASPREPLQFRPEGGVVRVSTRRQFDREDRPRTIRGAAVLAVTLIGLLIVAYIRRNRLGRWLAALRAHPFAAVAVFCLGMVAIFFAFASKPVEFVAFSRRITLDCGRGDLQMWLSPADPLLPYREPDAAVRARTLTPRTPVPVATIKSVRGLEVLHRPWPYEMWFIRARCATAAAVTGAVPLMWLGLRGFSRLKVRQRVKTGRCVACGYDLRGSEDRCPECGAERAGSRIS